MLFVEFLGKCSFLLRASKKGWSSEKHGKIVIVEESSLGKQQMPEMGEIPFYPQSALCSRYTLFLEGFDTLQNISK